MLTEFFKAPLVLKRLHATLAGPYLDEFARSMKERGYARSTVRLFLYGIEPLDRWMRRCTIKVASLDEETLDTYQFLGTKVYAVPDFAYRVDEKVHIWDWKTGKPREDDIFQLHTYALYACEKWQTDPEDIVLYAGYLGQQSVQTIPVEIEKLSEAQDRMSMSLREMMDVHYDPDVDDLMMKNWPASGAPEGCRFCRYKGMCPDAAV